MEGNALFEINTTLFGRHGGVEISANHAGRDAVHADVVVGEFASEGAGEVRNGAFDHLVSDVGDDTANAGGGGDEDDCAFTFLAHFGNDRATEMEDCMDVDIEGALPIFGRNFQQAAGNGSTSGVNEEIDGTEFLFDGANGIGGFAGDGVVSLDEFGAAAERLNLSEDSPGFVIEPAGGDGDIGARFGESKSGGSADAACAAGYQSDFTRELHQRVATDFSSFGMAATPMKPMNISLKDWSPQ